MLMTRIFYDGSHQITWLTRSGLPVTQLAKVEANISALNVIRGEPTYLVGPDHYIIGETTEFSK